MSYPYRLVDKYGVVHITNTEISSALYARCERDERGNAKPRFFGDNALLIVGDAPSCLWCVAR